MRYFTIPTFLFLNIQMIWSSNYIFEYFLVFYNSKLNIFGLWAVMDNTWHLKVSLWPFSGILWTKQLISIMTKWLLVAALLQTVLYVKINTSQRLLPTFAPPFLSGEQSCATKALTCTSCDVWSRFLQRSWRGVVQNSVGTGDEASYIVTI